MSLGAIFGRVCGYSVDVCGYGTYFLRMSVDIVMEWVSGMPCCTLPMNYPVARTIVTCTTTTSQVWTRIISGELAEEEN